jgi:hypothetical protein
LPRFPIFPSIDEGGSGALKNWKPEDSVVEEKSSSGKNWKTQFLSLARKSARTPAKPTTANPIRRGTKKEEDKLPPIELPKSKFFPTLTSRYIILFNLKLTFSLNNYQTIWKDRDETSNFAQKHDAELIKQELRPDVEKEVTLAVTQKLTIPRYEWPLMRY